MHRVTCGDPMRAFKTRGATAPALVEGKDPAYVGDGVGRWSHIAAKSKQPRPAAAARPQSIRTLIEIHERKLRDLYAEHRAGISDPARLAKVRADIDAKQNFTAKLWAELAANIKRGRA